MNYQETEEATDYTEYKSKTLQAINLQNSMKILATLLFLGAALCIAYAGPSSSVETEGEGNVQEDSTDVADLQSAIQAIMEGADDDAQSEDDSSEIQSVEDLLGKVAKAQDDEDVANQYYYHHGKHSHGSWKKRRFPRHRHSIRKIIHKIKKSKPYYYSKYYG